MRLSFDDGESFMEAAGNLQVCLNDPPDDPIAFQVRRMGSSSTGALPVGEE